MTDNTQELDKLCPICKGTTWQMNADYEEVPCWHDIHDEGFKQAIKSFIRNEKLKLLAEVRERVIGEDEPGVTNIMIAAEHAKQIDELTKLEAEL